MPRSYSTYRNLSVRTATPSRLPVPNTVYAGRSHAADGSFSSGTRLRPSSPAGTFSPHSSHSVGYRSSVCTGRATTLPLPFAPGATTISGTRAPTSNSDPCLDHFPFSPR